MAHFLRLIALFLLALPACSSTTTGVQQKPLKTARSVEIARYQGKWFEIARLPQWFQRDCASATAEYTGKPDGSIRVINTCLKADGTTRSVEGSAVPVDSTNNRLKVRFSQSWIGRFIPVPDEGNYWIIHLSPDYRYAIVGTPNRNALWFLSRSPEISRKTYQQLIDLSAQQGFDTSQLIVDQHTRLLDN